ncbi:MAG: bifunctional [glutamine synthetase] adenylyltransferase/[glutamine synthetase]-adenylyl-L-tyrosine phosphorylase [Hyphomicrobiales bacterium]|nr:bifunctional [glutamine synthetase] adenylyltransferase/[glutamine synthetase]-adenylyl-L-tyrosine phosphorylase [Hyphomicrobiales bacterium]MDE2115456.1 bifunctional [glutamine synthetase] adenylyltransferase/[glutamine synthetase]-adenylyl-L-tyrosine phosphorylase [Hyphomicrobiales bacterium]
MPGRWKLAQWITRSPRLADAKRARARLADLMRDERAIAANLPDLETLPAARDLLLGIADHSSFLWDIASRDPASLAALFEGKPGTIFAEGLARLALECDAAGDDEAVMRLLRLARRKVALLIALADIGGVWSIDEVMEALTAFADTATSAALRQALRAAAAGGHLQLADHARPEANCGLTVLALGKHGARELNYSSDIDLMLFFDPDASTIPEGHTPGIEFVRIARALVRLLQENTQDGYVLRVDLRLRPDPGSTPIAISLPAAFDYYATAGQNWERAALIKARPVAGDLELGFRFLADLAPFIWRKYFDYAAIADIHAMKRQIHAVRGHDEVSVAGHNIKLGRGGIREIEFFVQTQQLIFGGRRRDLRGSRTLDMLIELQRDAWITQETVEELSAAYRYLRVVEHRLQMIADEQTQRIPDDPSALARFARFMGHAKVSSFEAEMIGQLRRVEQNYARLFEHAPELHTRAGSLVFTGVEDDPDTVQTLAKMGFNDPSRAIETVRGWHFGRRPALRGERAREVLTELVPALIEALADSGVPDAALAALDEAMARMPAATELFTILRSNAKVRALFADILGGAPRLARIVEQRPHVLDAVIDPTSGHAPAAIESYTAAIGNLEHHAVATESFLNEMRNLAREEMFIISARTLSGTIDPPIAGHAYSALAEAILRAIMARVEADLAIEHGRVPGGRCAVVAMGRLGSREMTATSDLDLILIYEFGEIGESDGPKPLDATRYYARLTQRLIAALSALTARGKIYDIDMRLRPSGRAGPIATRFASFNEYQKSEAETWEHLALSRARVVAGDLSLAREIEACVTEVLCMPRDLAILKRDVRSMRKLVQRERGNEDPWDLKLADGGLMDIDFIAQFFVLSLAGRTPGLIGADFDAAMRMVVLAGSLPRDVAECLREARALMSAVTQLTRIAIEGRFDPDEVASGVLRRIASASGLPDFSALDAAVREARARTRRIFLEIFP